LTQRPGHAILNAMRRASCLLALVCCAGFGGCATLKSDAQGAPAQAYDPVLARNLPIYEGSSGAAVDWDHMIARLRSADVIILGEQHDDARAHAVQLAIVQDVLTASETDSHERTPAALSMEMLERDEQDLVRDYVDGFIDASAFAKLTESENWGGKGSWSVWYQPIIDAAIQGGARVIAANAPRRYVRLARLEGYERLEAMSDPRRSLFDLPQGEPDAEYHRRFIEVMSNGGHGDAAKPAPDAAAPEESVAPAITNGFRSQLLWDSTMGASIAAASAAGARPVIHLVGQFHSDFRGGTVQQVQVRLPDARIVTISMQRAAGEQLLDEDRDRADFVIYTGDSNRRR
jgi:uncharacterized iron-regulated protein